VETVPEGSRQGPGWYRADVDPAVKAVKIVACLYGMETSWLFYPSVPLTEVFREHTGSLARQQVLSPTRPCSRTR